MSSFAIQVALSVLGYENVYVGAFLLALGVMGYLYVIVGALWPRALRVQSYVTDRYDFSSFNDWTMKVTVFVIWPVLMVAFPLGILVESWIWDAAFLAFMGIWLPFFFLKLTLDLMRK